ncbi:transmembrane protein 177 [Phlebotomus argentipes]|uniref:transmembrane protein 177 n=1 Tax=Phlebotomus argentipes TaxID=94469 RepID=UPI002893300D|nr:transmembrane protein 177 [Phlebotomus argentipes]
MFKGFMKNKVVWAYRGATGAAILTFCAYYAPHTLLLSRYKDFMTCYECGKETKLPEKILDRFDKACRLLPLKDREVKLLKPFCSFGFDLFQAGTTKSHYGALIGIPFNYFYSSEPEIDRTNVKLQTKSVNWNSEDGKLLAESLILKEDEQIYGMAHSILMTSSHQKLLNASYASGSILGVYALGYFINRKLQTLTRPFIFRGVIYCLVSFFGFGMWAFIKDSTNVYYEGAADEALGSLGPEVADAGARFYGKLMNKNKALRGITQKNYYTNEGDIWYVVRTKSFPFTIRKAMLEQKLKEFQQPKEEIAQ